MTFSQLIEKLANGEPLSTYEKQELSLRAQRLEQAEILLNSIVRPGTKIVAVDGLETSDAKISNAVITDADIVDATIQNATITDVDIDNATITNATIETATIETPIITDPSWNSNPLHTCFVQRVADVSIPNGVNTYITFDTVNNFGDIWTVSGDKIFWNNIGQKAFSIKGFVTWAGNASGYRGLWIEGFDENDVSIGTSPLHTVAGHNLTDNVVPISFSFFFNGFSYVKFYVHQSSGGNLTMKDFLIGVSIA